LTYAAVDGVLDGRIESAIVFAKCISSFAPVFWYFACFAAKAAHGFECAFEALTKSSHRLCRWYLT
jgi:hypothetical protein